MVKLPKGTTQGDIFEAYRIAEGFENWSDMAAALWMSKQSLSTYVRDIARPDLKGLIQSAVEQRGTWIGDMCVDLILFQVWGRADQETRSKVVSTFEDVRV